MGMGRCGGLCRGRHRGMRRGVGEGRDIRDLSSWFDLTLQGAAVRYLYSPPPSPHPQWSRVEPRGGLCRAKVTQDPH